MEKKEPSLEFNVNNDHQLKKNVEVIKNRKQIIQQISSEEKDLYQKFLKKDLPKSSKLN